MSERLQARVYDELAKLAVEVEWEWLRLPQIRQLVAKRAVQAIDDTSTVTGEAYDGELDMARHLIRTLRLAARQGDLAAVQQALVNHAVDDANARDEAKKQTAADFFQPGHTYSEPGDTTDWRFRCDSITTHPGNGERTALGWRHFRGEWEPYAYDEDDFEIHQIADAIADGTGSGR